MQLLAAIALTATLYLPLVGGSNVAFPTTSILDNFNRADEMPLDQANWRDVFGVVVNTNQATISPDAIGIGFDIASLYNTTYGPDCDAYVTIPAIDIAGGPLAQGALLARYDPDTENGYSVIAQYMGGGGNDHVYIARRDAGSGTILATYHVTLADGDGIGIRCEGNNISAYHYTLGAWNLLGTQVDATYPGAGLAGIVVAENSAGTDGIPLDDFGAGDETGAAFPEPAVIDDFNRANEGPPPSVSWVDQYVMGVVTNEAAARQTPNVYDTPMLWRASIPATQEVYVTVSTRSDDGNDIGIYSRYQDYQNNLVLFVTRDDGGDDTIELYENVGGVNNSIAGPYIIDYQDGDAFGLYSNGANVDVQYKPFGGAWASQGIGITTLPVAGGYIGFQVIDTTARLDDFGGGEYVAPPIPPGPWRQGAGRAKSGGTRSGKIQDVAAYSITTPDGITTDLRDKGFTVGVGDIQDGMGMPPVEAKTWTLFNNPGALLRSIQVGPRVVTINASLNADCLQALHDLRNKLFQALRWNRTLSDPPDPAVLHYTLNGKRADLYVYYAGDITARIGNSNTDQTIGVRLIAYDPLWYSPTEISKTLGGPYTLPISFIVGKIDGIWNDMGNSGTSIVYAMVVSPDGNTLYIGGAFTNWDGIANADYIAAYDIPSGTWSALSTGMDREVLALAIGPDGRLYAGGSFTTAGGVTARKLAVWDGVTWAPVGAFATADGAPPATYFVSALAFDQDGILYAGGSYTAAQNGTVTDRLEMWNGTVWTQVLLIGVAVPDNTIYALAVGPNGILYAGGLFLNIGGIGASYIAQWNGAVWNTLSTGLSNGVRTIAVDSAGLVYIGGTFATAGGVTVNNITVWNGVTFASLNGGTNGDVNAIAVSDTGLVYAGGTFSTAGGVTLADNMGVWNGTTWAPVDIDFQFVTIIFSMVTSSTNLFVGFNFAGDAIVPYSAISAVTAGDFKTFPIFTITGPATLRYIINETTDKRLIFDLTINYGETITIDLSPGVKNLSSSWPLRPSVSANLVLPQSDLGSWSLEPDPIAPGGVNTITVYMTGTIPVALNDDQGPAGAAQLDDWEDITGASCLNTAANGVVYVSIIADGGGFFHVELYSDAARTHLIGHTASYNAGGAQAIVADNASGLGGTITIVSATAADDNIVAYFSTVCATYFDRHLSVDHAIQ